MAEEGLVGAGCSLAARFLALPGWVLINSPRVEDGGRLALLPIAPVLDSAYLIIQLGTTGHFPYGEQDFIEPDFPV